MRDFYTITPCPTSNAFEIKFKRAAKINIDKAVIALTPIGQVLGKTPIVLFFKSNNCAASIYASGRVVLKNVGREEAERIGRNIAEALEAGRAFNDQN